MRIDKLILEVREQLDEPGSSYLSSETILRWLNQGQEIIAREAGYLQDREDLATFYGLPYYTIPRLLGVIAASYHDGGNAYPLKGVSWHKISRLGPDVYRPGPPRYYVARRMLLPDDTGANYNFFLAPPPDKSDAVVSVFYYAAPEEMICAFSPEGEPIQDDRNVDPSLPEAYQDALITWCLYKLLRKQQDPMYAGVRAEFFEEVRRIREAEFSPSTAAEDEMAIEYY